jgi:predicted XRE-type DNA-binding protein
MARANAQLTNTSVEIGSGNVFEDLGLPDANERLLRTELAVRLNQLIETEGLTQAVVAKKLKLSQPHVSELKHYKLSRFSSERLLHYITLFNRDVDIFIRPTKTNRQQLSTGAVAVWSMA